MCSSRPDCSPAAVLKGTAAAVTCSWYRARSIRSAARRRAGRGGCCSCAPLTRRARIWPPRCGAGPVRSRRHRPEPIRRRGSRQARSPPPGGITCRCAASGRGISAMYARTATSSSRCATGPGRNSASWRRCTGQSPTPYQPATPIVSTRPWLSWVIASSGSRRPSRLLPEPGMLVRARCPGSAPGTRQRRWLSVVSWRVRGGLGARRARRRARMMIGAPMAEGRSQNANVGRWSHSGRWGPLST